MRTNQTHNNNNGKNSNTESKLQQKTQITQKYKSIHVLERRPMSFILDTDVPYACLFLTPVCSLRMSVPYACLFLTHVCSLRMSVPYECLFLTHVCSLHMSVPYECLFLTNVCSLRMFVPYTCLFLTHVCSLRMSVPYACLFLTHVCSLRMSVPYACLFLTHVCSLRMSVLSNVCFQWRKTFTWSLVTTVTLNLTVSIFLCSDIPWQAEWITAKVSLPNELFLIFIWEERRFRHFVERPADIFTWSTVIGLLLRHKQRLRETAKNDNYGSEIAI